MADTREVGDHGQCEVVDLVPTVDDAVAVRCPRQGRCILEDMGEGRPRLRFVCPAHGLTSAYTVN